jgi:hypothetical protein
VDQERVREEGREGGRSKRRDTERERERDRETFRDRGMQREFRSWKFLLLLMMEVTNERVGREGARSLKGGGAGGGGC